MVGWLGPRALLALQPRRWACSAIRFDTQEVRKAFARRSCPLLWHRKCPAKPPQAFPLALPSLPQSTECYFHCLTIIYNIIFIHLLYILFIPFTSWIVVTQVYFGEQTISSPHRASRMSASCSALCSFGYPVAGEAAARRPMYRITKSCN